MTDSSSNGSTKPDRDTNCNRVAAKAEHKSASPLASQRAAAILDVLAGQRTTSEAAVALEISVNHYYLLERKALEGLTAACEPQVKGTKGPSLESQLQSLQRQLEQSRRECLRQAALVRATQRAVGLAAVPEPKKSSRRKTKGGTGRKKRPPTVRALRAAEVIRKNSSRLKPEIPLERGTATEKGAVSDSPPSNSPKEQHDGKCG
jgi:hypothetical protein